MSAEGSETKKSNKNDDSRVESHQSQKNSKSVKCKTSKKTFKTPTKVAQSGDVAKVPSVRGLSVEKAVPQQNAKKAPLTNTGELIVNNQEEKKGRELDAGVELQDAKKLIGSSQSKANGLLK